MNDSEEANIQQPDVLVSEVVSSKSQEQANRRKIKVEVTWLKARVANLCRPCPWDWTLFLGNCYFFSKSERSWHDAVTACQEVGAQLVVIKSHEEQVRLMGAISWSWAAGKLVVGQMVDFMKYWNEGEPNNAGEEDCAEFRGDGWNDVPCALKKLWICKKSAASCSMK
ncbi:CD209 antigen-like protein C [Nannospalax galili]|uniref:CD209 antigen-like protein C n=1 Tax=Nannospalax galili TaxID=1026970 RepID=UPI000819AB03|nr:CD209 antigen-like protein C [Nannospalax galili]